MVWRMSPAVTASDSRYIRIAEVQVGRLLGLPMPKIFVDSNALTAAVSLLVRLGAKEVFVFGSATKDGLRPDSDIDMAVRGLPASVYFSAISKATDLLGRPIDIVDLDDPTPIVRYLLDSGELVRVA